MTTDSVVVDLGGYVGQWAEDIHQKYDCEVHIFEPHPRFFEICERRFSANPRIKVYGYGLSDIDGMFDIHDDDDGSSFFKGSGKGSLIPCRMRSAEEVFRELGLHEIDLLKMNIEGGEYHVLPNLIRSNYIENIRFLQVQFHAINNLMEGRELIREALSRTHNEQWCYEFVWEGWELSRGQRG